MTRGAPHGWRTPPSPVLLEARRVARARPPPAPRLARPAGAPSPRPPPLPPASDGRGRTGPQTGPRSARWPDAARRARWERGIGRRSGPGATAPRQGADGVLPSMIFLRDGVEAAAAER